MIGALLLGLIPLCAEEATWEYAVQVSATVQTSPPQITLTWPQDNVVKPSSYTVYRKSLNDTDWGEGTVLAGTITNYVDTNITDGAAYEYQIIKVTSQYNGYGYIYAGMDVPLTESRGTVVLIVDNTYAADLSDRLARLQQDLVGDGWTVLRHDVSRTDSVQYVKSLIQSDYFADPADVNTVFLFGHVPVPYSGDIVPDEHIPNHQGAWPADVYYADMYGTWTDYSVNDTNADSPRNWNVPGDGKFDQSYPPNPVQLMVGRVDLYNLPGLTTYDGPPTLPDEETLLANYLDKDHNFRTKAFDLPRRGVIGNYFGDFGGEAFAASGWRNFAPFFGPGNITDLPNEGTWMPTLSQQPYLWAYGCGGGSYNAAVGLGTDDQYDNVHTPDFYPADIQTVFTMVFGSWFGDWDQEDDLMRGVLTAPTYTLACLWSGNPHWFCHHMALGMTLGYSTRLTQNNGPDGLYQTKITAFAGQVHIALMGDPTLLMHVVAPPADLAANVNGDSVQLSWIGSPDNIMGYLVYRAPSDAGPFTRLNDQLVTDITFTDYNPPSGSVSYMVRAVKLEETASGTYYNASEGIFMDVNFNNTVNPPVIAVYPGADASRIGSILGAFTFTRAGDTSTDLTVYYSLSGTASWEYDYSLLPANADYFGFTFPASMASTTITVVPLPGFTLIGNETVELTLEPSPDSEYTLGDETNATINMTGNGISGIQLQVSNAVATLSWPSDIGRAYHVLFDDAFDDSWYDFGVEIDASGPITTWSDPDPAITPQRFYQVFEVR